MWNEIKSDMIDDRIYKKYIYTTISNIYILHLVKKIVDDFSDEIHRYKILHKFCKCHWN